MQRNSFIRSITATLLICLALFISCTEKQYDTDAARMNLKGRVQSVSEQFYYARNQFDQIVLDAELYSRYYEFDTLSRYKVVVHENMYLGTVKQDYSDDQVIAAVEPDSLYMEEDGQNDLLVDSTFSDSSLNPEPDNILKLFQANEPLNEPDYLRKEYNYITDSSYVVYKFDKEGGQLGFDECFIYTAGNQPRLINSYLNDSKLLSKTVYVYDNNKLSNQTIYFENTSYETYYKYSFGRKKESFSYIANLLIHSYNWAGRPVKTEVYTGSQHVSVIQFTYDKQGNIASQREEFTQSPTVKESVFHYRYDEAGNWTERIERRNDGNTFVTKRTITYN